MTERRRHRTSRSMLGVALVGLTATVCCVVMARLDRYEQVPWQALTAFIGIPTALLLAFSALARAREGDR